MSPATNPEFRSRVQAELERVARQRQADPQNRVDSGGRSLARAMARQPARFAWTFAHAVCVLNAGLTLASTNEEIRNTIQQVWDIIAE